MSDIRVIVAEDEFFTRQGIVKLLQDAPGIEVVAEASNGEQAVELVTTHRPDVLLLDIRMPPGINGIEVVKRLRAAENPVLIIALTNENRLVKKMEAAGANGFIPKTKYHMFIPTVMCVAQSRTNLFINPDVTEKYRKLDEKVKAAGITPAEMEVLRLIGFKNEEIARRLNKTAGRVRNIVAELYFKLDIHDNGAISQRNQAMQMASMLGILEGFESFAYAHDETKDNGPLN
ncbi:response regulator transcription factor [Acanthopleuribacter pedis]|uniref:Response regulator transcription factor n=1 Tax=Acanthopleuribacter pedis TaxID=442870 RepID=A0A8J7U3K2_9BACT|nr:response regulator transcription factor [Acanthopleuribacter pedis]MBO1319712.1 response regulator transcription factor [Acanthopleuribacter pedis]